MADDSSERVPEPWDGPLPGTLIEFRAVYVVRSRKSSDDADRMASFPRAGYAYAARSRFVAGRIDIEERSACRSRQKLGLPKGEVTCVILNVPLGWIVWQEVENDGEVTEGACRRPTIGVPGTGRR